MRAAHSPGMIAIARSINRMTVFSKPMRSTGESAIDAAATNCSTSSASVGGGSGGGGGSASGAFALNVRSKLGMPAATRSWEYSMPPRSSIRRCRR